MQRLFLILTVCLSLNISAETVTYIVNGRTSVRSEGVEPVGSLATYSETSTTGRVGQLTQGNCARFSIAYLPEIIIKDITIMMHSNTTSGAGDLILQHNRQVVTMIDDAQFSSPTWNGSFTTAFVPISLDIANHIHTAKGDSVVIDVCATANSLYIGEIAVTYTVANDRCYSVAFHTDTEQKVAPITESNPNAGVVIPDYVSPLSDWQFCGWSVTPVNNLENCPQLLHAGERFYPMENTTLYAVYYDSISTERKWVQDTLFQTGDYLIADTWYHVYAQGKISNGKIETQQLPEWMFTEDSLCYTWAFRYEEDAVYHIEFISDSMASITNKGLNDAVGYPSSSSSLQLTHSKQPWSYRLLSGHQIIFYHDYQDNTRYLHADVGSTLETINIIRFAAYSIMFNNYSLVLLNTADMQDNHPISYTSFPLSADVEDVAGESVVVTPQGVQNPQHRSLRLYTLSGLLLMETNADISFSQLDGGIYILHDSYCGRKVVVQ